MHKPTAYIISILLCLILTKAALVSQSIELDHGVEIPRVGFGTAGLGGMDASVVMEAVAAGVRLIDTAQAPEWYSEERVGRGLSDYLSAVDGTVSYTDLYIVTKVHPRSFQRNALYDAMSTSRRLLRNNHGPVDLALLHSPFCWQGHCTRQQESHTWQEAWRGLEEMKMDGSILRNIGVSNFGASQLQELLVLTNTKVTAVQNWCDPYHQDREVRALAAEHGVLYMAYSSLGTQWQGKRDLQHRNPVLNSPELLSIAAAYGTTVSDVVMCWLLQEDALVIPRSTSSEHILANSMQHRAVGSTHYQCFLSELDLAVIRALDGTLGTPWD
jgi:diketogulonate reductase-like aldo/keto reductase